MAEEEEVKSAVLDRTVQALVEFYPAVDEVKAIDEIETFAKSFADSAEETRKAVQSLEEVYGTTEGGKKALMDLKKVLGVVDSDTEVETDSVKEQTFQPEPLYVGVDAGGLKTTAAITSPNTVGEVKSLRNDNMNVVTPSCLSLPGSECHFRKYGDQAQCDHGNEANTFSYLIYLCHDLDQIAELKQSVLTTAAWQEATTKTKFDADTHFQLQETEEGADLNKLPTQVVSAREIFAMHLRRIYVSADKVRSAECPIVDGAPRRPLVCSIAVPSCFSQKHRLRLHSAAKIAGFEAAHIITNIQCLAASYLLRHIIPHAKDLNFPLVIGFADYGAAQFSVGTVVYFLGSDQKPTFHIIDEESVVGHAGDSIDRALALHFANEFVSKSKSGTGAVSLISRKGKRLVRACSRAKVALSINAENKFMVDAMGENGEDARFTVTRDQLNNICENQFLQLRKASQKVYNSVASVMSFTASDGSCQTLNLTKENVSKVEIVGGGSRSPVVQDTISTAFGLDKSSLSFMLDIQLSLSQGAVLVLNTIVAQPPGKVDATENNTEDAVEIEANCRILAQQWEELDLVNQQQHFLRDNLERFISSMRIAISESASAPENERLDGPYIEPLLADAEELTWAAWKPGLGDECEAKRVELEAKIKERSAGYFVAKETKKANYEAELDALAAKAKAEADAAGPSEEDHDRRKLKVSKRLKNAHAQKAEGNELFSGKNYLPATVRSETLHVQLAIPLILCFFFFHSYTVLFIIILIKYFDLYLSC